MPECDTIQGMIDSENAAQFENLTPDVILDAVESHCGVFLDGVITPYNSYINRVFGLRDEDENDFIVKFYRPERWTKEGILDEHAFLFDCAELEIPVIPPILPKDGSSAGETSGFLFAVFPRVRARTFDVTCDEDWIRIGAVIGRMHRAGKKRQAPNRLRCTPEETTERYIASLLDAKLVHPEFAPEFADTCREALDIIKPLFDGVAVQRIHGDCHRGNILESRDKGVTLIDFDDMMTGPAVQDLWLLLSGHLADSMAEMNLILEGYAQFEEFDYSSLRLVEPLRFMRHIYFLNWCAMQRFDTGFVSRNPDWGNRAFWIQETADLSAQLDHLRAGQYI